MLLGSDTVWGFEPLKPTRAIEARVAGRRRSSTRPGRRTPCCPAGTGRAKCSQTRRGAQWPRDDRGIDDVQVLEPVEAPCGVGYPAHGAGPNGVEVGRETGSASIAQLLRRHARPRLELPRHQTAKRIGADQPPRQLDALQRALQVRARGEVQLRDRGKLGRVGAGQAHAPGHCGCRSIELDARTTPSSAGKTATRRRRSQRPSGQELVRASPGWQGTPAADLPGRPRPVVVAARGLSRVHTVGPDPHHGSAEPRRRQSLKRLAPRGGFNPTWSPDGRCLAFERVTRPGQVSIYVMRTNGTRLRLVTRTNFFVFSQIAWQQLR